MAVNAPVEEQVSTPDVTTPASDPWTSQSGPEVHTETEGAELTPDPELPPAAAEFTPTEQKARDAETGQFTGSKKKGRRDNPYEAVKQATGETAKERQLRQAAETRASELERRLAEKEQVSVQPAVGESTDGRKAKPKIDDYLKEDDPYWAGTEGLMDWKLDERLKSLNIEQQIAQYFQFERARQAMEQHVSGIVQRGRETYPDFEQVRSATTVPFSAAHHRAIVSHPSAEHLIYALSKDENTARELAAIPLEGPQAVDNAMRLALEFAKLVPSNGVAARPDSTHSTRVSTAKPPINRVGGTASAVPVDPDDLEFGPEYIKAENERERKRKEANRWS